MTGCLIDTNVISEWSKPRPAPRVADFVLKSRQQQLFVSSVCIAEIRHGADTASSAEARNRLINWLENELRPFFRNRVLEVSEDVVLTTLKLTAQSARRRQTLHFADSLIAATAHVHRLVVVTRNVKDFLNLSIPVLNPWTGERFNGA